LSWPTDFIVPIDEHFFDVTVCSGSKTVAK
jgi:hypothetical protein